MIYRLDPETARTVIGILIFLCAVIFFASLSVADHAAHSQKRPVLQEPPTRIRLDKTARSTLTLLGYGLSRSTRWPPDVWEVFDGDDRAVPAARVRYLISTAPIPVSLPTAIQERIAANATD